MIIFCPSISLCIFYLYMCVCVCKDTELFMRLLVIHMPSFMNCMFNYFIDFKIVLFNLYVYIFLTMGHGRKSLKNI